MGLTTRKVGSGLQPQCICGPQFYNKLLGQENLVILPWIPEIYPILFVMCEQSVSHFTLSCFGHTTEKMLSPMGSGAKLQKTHSQSKIEHCNY